MLNQVKGKLYVVATPIGNLEDISIRAKKTLESVSWIACEDTRHSALLLNYLGIQKTLYALHDFNEKEKAIQLIQKLVAGESGALISDAGTPLISDPGYELINLAYQSDIQVVPIPGACAFIAALSALGIGTHHFYFEGFLPAKPSARVQRLEKLKNHSETLIFYEAPHRIKASLKALCEVLGEHRLAGIGRELTKKFESFYRGTLKELQALDIPEKGEFVIVIEGISELEQTDSENMLSNIDIKETLKILMESVSLKQAVELTSRMTGMKKNKVYDLALLAKTDLGA